MRTVEVTSFNGPCGSVERDIPPGPVERAAEAGKRQMEGTARYRVVLTTMVT